MDDFIRLDVTALSETEDSISTSITCRTIRVGSHKFDAKEKVIFTLKGIRIVAPSVKNPKELIELNIQDSEIIKLIIHDSKMLNVLFLYTKPSCGLYVRDSLNMTLTNDKSPYFHPMSKKESQKKIVFVADGITEDVKSTLKAIYSRDRLDDINNRDANELLIKSTGSPYLASTSTVSNNSLTNNSIENMSSNLNIKKMLIYPPGRGISINTADYMCLASDQYLNDVIIDFYLNYLLLELISEEQRNKTHLFSQFFYKRLTTMTRDKDPKLPAAQKRHSRVKTWTKNVNLFEKDFIIIPINEQSHWFLAIICFPHLTEPHTIDGNQPIKLIPARQKKKKVSQVQIGNTTITALRKREIQAFNLNDDEGSERDEAEGDESELGSGSDSEEEVVDKGQPVKLPCILIFDSLTGASRARVVATLRDYLTCEYRAKHPNNPPRVFNKSNMAGNLVKVPQQNNFTDCGLFLLQYVEQFFIDPIKDYRIPIKGLVNWFHEDVVTRKREDISILLKELMKREQTDTEEIELPEIEFPTKDGRILEYPDEESEAQESAFDDNEYLKTEEELKETASENEKGELIKISKNDEGTSTEGTRIVIKKRGHNDSSNGSIVDGSVTPKLSKISKTKS